MSAIVCPWCQSEIIQEEGAEPEKYCPFCENELDGYRTLTIGIGDPDEDEEDDAPALNGEEDLSWMEDKELQEKNEAFLQVEENVEKLLDEQEIVPECPVCREYMVETGEQIIGKDSFHPRVPHSVGETLLEAPFSLTIHVCPACFTVTHSLSEEGRLGMLRRLSKGRER